MSDYTFTISIPSDNDGFVLLKCPKCGEYFKLTPADIESRDMLDIHCPLCGLVSDNYYTNDVIELARTKATNYALNILYEEFKKMERNKHNSFLKIKAEKPKEELETPIKSTIDSMRIINYSCCGKQAKIRHLLSFTVSYCPFCGGVYDGTGKE